MTRAVTCLVLLTVPAIVYGQTGASLMIKPFTEGKASETQTGWMFTGQGHIRDASDSNITLSHYDVEGRFRFDAADPDSPRVGYAWSFIDIDTDDPRLPSDLSDQAIAAGFGLFETDKWRVGATIGVGYAGDSEFDDDDPWYATANLIASQQIDDVSSLQLLLSYDGNRSIFPDIPLPGIIYHRRVSDTFQYSLGVPYSQVVWTPTPKWRISASGAIPASALNLGFNADANYEVDDSLSLFASYGYQMRAFSVGTLSGNDRLFFEQRRAEGGLRWTPVADLDVTLAGGFAFDRRFRQGFDVRSLSDSIKISDEPYVRFAVDFRF